MDTPTLTLTPETTTTRGTVNVLPDAAEESFRDYAERWVRAQDDDKDLSEDLYNQSPSRQDYVALGDILHHDVDVQIDEFGEPLRSCRDSIRREEGFAASILSWTRCSCSGDLTLSLTNQDTEDHLVVWNVERREWTPCEKLETPVHVSRLYWEERR